MRTLAPLLSVALVQSSAASGSGSVGVDLSVATNSSTWSCVLNELQETSSSHEPFAVVRVYRNIGEVDANAPDTIHAAHRAGFRRFNAYVFPCIESSPFAQSRDDVECPSAKQQLTDTLDFLSENFIAVAKEKEVENAAMPTIQRIYLDIEDQSPSYYFDSDTSVNEQFVESFVKAASDLGVPLGFYTTSTYWKNIMNDTPQYSEPEYPLWYPRWDETNSMDFFEPFGGWKKVLMKQTAGDVALCGISQVDKDYMEM